MQLGTLTMDPVIDGVGRFRPTRTFTGTTDDDWSIHRDLLDSEGRLQFVMGGFLVRGNGHTTLIDLGLGTGTLMGIEGGAFLTNLATAGVQPDDVTDVLFTHLHSDHIGWAVHDGRPTFANATLRASQADIDHFVHGTGADEKAGGVGHRGFAHRCVGRRVDHHDPSRCRSVRRPRPHSGFERNRVVERQRPGDAVG